MIKAPSIQSEYSFIFSGDPALSLPENDEERALALKLARETGDWTALLGGQSEPTVFHLKQLKRSELGWLQGEAQHSTTWGRPLSPLEVDDLTVRLALHGVDNFGKHKVTRKPVAPGSKIYVAQSDIVDAIHEDGGEVGSAIISELAQHIIERATSGLRPL